MCLSSLFPSPILLLFCLLPKPPPPPPPVPDMVYFLPTPSHPNGPDLAPPIQKCFKAPPAKELYKNEVGPDYQYWLCVCISWRSCGALGCWGECVTVKAWEWSNIFTYTTAYITPLYYIQFIGIATTLQRTNTENSKRIFPKKELRGHSPNFHIHVVSVSDLYIPTIDLPFLLQEICGVWTDPGKI